MKTYEEMAQSALARGKAMRTQRQKTKKRLMGLLATTTASLLVILLITTLGGPSDAPSPTPTLGSQSQTPSEGNDPGSWGPVNFLSAIHKTDTSLTGQAFQYIAGKRNPINEFQPSPPQFEFDLLSYNVVAKAVEELPGIYQSLNEYGSTETNGYRLLRMEVIDDLQSGIEGTFYYLLPQDLKGDLTKYDALLISMCLLPQNYVLRCGGELVAFEYLFADHEDLPQLGNIIAFTDGVFDESLWQEESWYYGYQFAKSYLDRGNGNLLVDRGSTLEGALQRREIQLRENYQEPQESSKINLHDYQTEAAREAMEYLKPFENGIFIPERIRHTYRVRRYINGCPTNEWVEIDPKNETVTRSEYRFEDADFENLPDLASYIADLDLTKLTPQHIDTTGKTMSFNSAVGWYEKTDTGVYAVVRVAWSFWEWLDIEDYSATMGYYDETFILLDETGAHVISREELTALIGQNRNIYYGEYGVGEERLA